MIFSKFTIINNSVRLFQKNRMVTKTCRGVIKYVHFNNNEFDGPYR